MIGKAQQIRQAAQELKNPRESERIRATADILVEIERAQREAVMDQRDALDVNPDDTDRLNPDDRRDVLLDVIEGMTPGGVSLPEVWLKHCPPEEIDADDPTTLTAYANLTEGEWTTQIEAWAETYRSQIDGRVASSDRELADHHVQTRWDVSLPTFEELVVNFDRERALRDLLAGPSETTEEAIRAATEAVA